MSKQIVETGARRIVIGWLEPGSSRRDAMDVAKAYAQKFFDAPDASWYAIMPFMDGWFWEAQEGGSGRSYLNGVAKVIVADEEGRWIRVGNRAMSIGLRDGKPFCVLMSEADSALMMAGEGRVGAAGKMQRVVKRGTGVLVSGLVVAISGFLFLSSATGYHFLTQTYVPSEREINIDLLPHGQWDRVGGVPPNLFVERLELLPGEDRWKTTVKPIQRSTTDAGSPEPLVPPPDDVLTEIVESVVETSAPVPAAVVDTIEATPPSVALPTVGPIPADPVPLPAVEEP